ncbi:hypothetical protein F2Q69_00004645 [Brassica cretica]|uniref:Uncharacterized protein n=1 Tax=Brassica cretica TaxID=69181 RepID=A0A8S9P0R6_BRACR|nr:hypothetical protein F2Q69_00004645 [Brassica cretica]
MFIKISARPTTFAEDFKAAWSGSHIRQVDGGKAIQLVLDQSTVEKLEAGKKRRGNASGNDTSEPSSHKKRKHEVTQKSSDEADPESVISSPQNVPEDKHELPSNQTQAPPSGMGVLSEIVKITKVTCETEVINKVSNIECSDDPSEAGTKMTGIKEKDSDDGGHWNSMNPQGFVSG